MTNINPNEMSLESQMQLWLWGIRWNVVEIIEISFIFQAPQDQEQAQANVSPEVVYRMKIVASVCLSYGFRLLTHVDHSPGVPNDLR